MVKNTSEYMRAYYLSHKDKYLRKRLCDFCNKTITISNFHKHLQKPVHLKNSSKDGIEARLKAIEKELKTLEDQKVQYSDLLKAVEKIESEGETLTEIVKLNKAVENLKRMHCEE